MVFKITIDADTCTGCGACTGVAPEVFKMDESTGKAVPIKETVESADKAKEGQDSCPVSAIKIE